MDQKPIILVAEDDAFLRNAYNSKFTKAGFVVVLATDGIEAMDMLKVSKPDVILLDLVMPRQDGFATLSQIKLLPEYKDIPVIISSNLGQKEDIERALTQGASDYIIKSNMSLEEIVGKVRAKLLVKNA